MVEKRTLTSRTFKGDKGQILIQQSSKNINYFDGEKKLQPINHRLQTFENGWWAPHQQFPVYLFKDGSTAVSSEEGDKIIFNRNCKINGNDITISDFTVGEDGMYIENFSAGIDKRIWVRENEIETDYIIEKPLNQSLDLIFSEEIGLPEGYLIEKRISNELSNAKPEIVIFSPDGKEKARFHAPVFFDHEHKFLTAEMELIQKNGIIILKFTLPSNWLNDPSRVFPVTIDPLVTGPVSNYQFMYLPSCEFPNFSIDSMLVTIPGGITITFFNVEDNYYADFLVSALMTKGYMRNSTICGTVQGTCIDSAKSGTCYWTPGQDFKNQLTCCFTPSCNPQSFYLTHGFARTPAIYGFGCAQDAIYYNPNNQWGFSTTFSAYIEGRTVEISSPASVAVFPTTVCSDSCTIYLKAGVKYGVPPYTMTHPWSVDTIQFGNSITGCNSTGTDTIALVIPGCPYNCNSSKVLAVPPPLIVDVCGDTVSGLVPDTITINPVPVATAVPVNNFCSGNPVSINVSSCVAGSNITWTGSNGSSGTGNISDIPGGTAPTTINYTINLSASGCAGPAANVSALIYPVFSTPVSAQICSGTSIFLQGGNQTVSGTYYDTLTTTDGCDSAIITTLSVSTITSLTTAEICEGENILLQGNLQSTPGLYYDTVKTALGCDSIVKTDLAVFPKPVLIASPDFTINSGTSATLSVTGGNNYLWSTGDTLPSINITPASTTIYTVTGTNSDDCSSTEVVVVTVKELFLPNEISVSNVFTPNGDNQNDFVFVHGNNIAELEFTVFDRLGEKVFETNDKSIGWDGKHKGKPLNSAVFAYSLYAKFTDGSDHKEKGNISLVK